MYIVTTEVDWFQMLLSCKPKTVDFVVGNYMLFLPFINRYEIVGINFLIFLTKSLSVQKKALIAMDFTSGPESLCLVLGTENLYVMKHSRWQEQGLTFDSAQLILFYQNAVTLNTDSHEDGGYFRILNLLFGEYCVEILVLKRRIYYSYNLQQVAL
ncbi:hypothetical protein ACJX0J_033886 [Zea mays]